MALAIINLLAAFFRAFPKVSELVECALDAAATANVAEAVERWNAKNKAVSEALKNAKDKSNN